MTSQRYTLQLTGCTPQPLMSYLKALGILRLVSEQADPEARGWWEKGIFVLNSKLSETDLVEFFIKHYEPTPIIVPWAGNDFFDFKEMIDNLRANKYSKYSSTPKGAEIIAAFMQISSPRISKYKTAITQALKAFEICGIKKKEEIEKNKKRKAHYTAILRSIVPDEVVPWIDAAIIISQTATVTNWLLGAGGGNDGNTHFSDNFMQNLYDVLPEFDELRKKPGDTYKISSSLLQNAIFGTFTHNLIKDRTSALYDPGAVGGPNATTGMERKSISNPWNIILLFEGIIGFAGAIYRRLNPLAVTNQTFPSFPFHFFHNITTEANTVEKEEEDGREQWVPIWERPATWSEISYILKEGRAEIGKRNANQGIDMARALTSLGIDRGLKGFFRYGILKGRVGGENYVSTTLLGFFPPRYIPQVKLLDEIDGYLFKLSKAVKNKKSKNIRPKIQEIRTRLLSGIWRYTRSQERRDLLQILIYLGELEREIRIQKGAILSSSPEDTIQPITIKKDWLIETFDGSMEYEIALSMAYMHGIKELNKPIRCYLEPVEKKGDAPRFQWKKDSNTQCWTTSSLPQNILCLLERLIIDAGKHSLRQLPLSSAFLLDLNHIRAFLFGYVNDSYIDKLIWGILLASHTFPENLRFNKQDRLLPPLPRAYALLKLLFLPRPLVREWDAERERWRWRLARSDEEGISIRPEPRILSLLRADHVGEACRLAYQRLRASGLQPLPAPHTHSPPRESEWCEIHGIDSQRLAAALLFPISDFAVNQLIQLVTRQDEEPEQEPETLTLT